MTAKTVTPEQAAAAYLERKAIRGSLAKWAEHCGFIPARHHRMLIEHLEKVASGEIMRLACSCRRAAPKAPTPLFCFRLG